MMQWIDFVRGTARVCVTGAYPQQFLNQLAKMHAPFWDITHKDELSLEVTVYRAMLGRCRIAAQRAMCQLEVLSLHGARAVFYGLKRRPVLMVGLLMVIALTLWSQQYVWTIEVQGNETVNHQQILRTLAQLGVGVGTKRTDIQPQALENRVLDQIRELSWFTINANSTRAVVLVKERLAMPELVNSRAPTNVVAARDGFVEEMEVYDGQALVEPGDTVLRGQLLVSGLTTAYQTTILHHAMAEVYARTWHSAEILCAEHAYEKEYTGESETQWRLLVGDKLMKIYVNSGIPQNKCDKITVTYPLTLPGGIVLPIALEKTTIRYYAVNEVPREEAVLKEQMITEFSDDVRAQMIAGKIHSVDTSLTLDAGLWRMTAMCECTEQIGVLSPIINETKEDESG